jgi:ubiquinone/menaquinone biosynthesis C-methylase UbiE
MRWNHNIHYHDVILRAMPPRCRHALDVGCGRGTLAQKMARRSQEVLAIDTEPECLAFARATSGQQPNLTFLQADILEQPFSENSFDFVCAVASLHHLPIRRALERFGRVIRPGGTLAILGLYRDDTPVDRAVGCIVFPISWTIRRFKGEAEVGAPVQEPMETLREIRSECDSVLPGGIFRRRLFFRYSFVWRKP